MLLNERIVIIQVKALVIIVMTLLSPMRDLEHQFKKRQSSLSLKLMGKKSANSLFVVIGRTWWAQSSMAEIAARLK